MTFGNRRRRVAELVVVIGLTAMIGSCDTKPTANAGVKADASVGVAADTPVDMPAASPVASDANRLVNGLDGIWRVAGVAVAADAPSVFGTDDPALMGSEVTISDTALAWTRKASADFTADDVCNGPRVEPVAADASPNAVPPEFAGAMARFATGEKTGGVFHWVCTKGGNWGPEADDGARMLRLGDNRLVMGWYDGVVVMLERSAA